MSKIVAKLNLNKTPQLVDNNSLVMAKNIRLLKDGTIGPDTSLKEIEHNVGNGTSYVVHHDEVTEDKTIYKYTILNVDTTIDYIKNGNLPDESDLNSVAFDFFHYNPTEETERVEIDDSEKYVEIHSDVSCSIYCYNYIEDEENIEWCREQFHYNPNDNILKNNNDYCLLLAVREDIYNETEPINGNILEYCYIILPKVLLNQTIVIRKINYKVINPVYLTKSTETIIIQPSYDEDGIYYNTVKYIGQIVGLDNKIYFFRESNYIEDSPEARKYIRTYYPNEKFVGDDTPNLEPTFDVNADNYITRRGILFDDIQISYELIPFFINRVRIFEYDEIAETFTIVKCAWKYSGGKINGCVTVNATGEPILTICEYDLPGNILVPIKHINLAKCKWSDDESFYTQAPNIPISNIIKVDKYIKNIPSGVYQFFIRYKIHDDFYTDWFPCSKDLFAGSKKQSKTLQGSLQYVDLHEDSNESFVLYVEHLFKQYCNKFEQYQLGFIVSSDGGSFARSWKHFDIHPNQIDQIYFEYNQEDIQEINIDDLLKSTYDIFNVNNVVPYKNKLYIANYKETDFNEDLNSYAKDIRIKLKLKDVSIDDSYDYYFNGQGLNESEVTGVYDSFDETLVKDTFCDNQYCDIRTNISTETTTWGDIDIDSYNNDYYQALFSNKIKKVYTTYNNIKYYILGNDNTDVNIVINSTDNETVINTVIDNIKNKIIGIDVNGIYQANINNVIIPITNFSVEYEYYTTSQPYEDEYDNSQAIGTFVDVYNHTSILTQNITLKQDIISQSTPEYSNKEYNTLLPFTNYDFYVHYVKQNGIVTNGYYIGTKQVKRYCKGYKEIDETDVPEGEAVEVESIDNINDLSYYSSEDNQYIYYHDDDLNIDRYFELEEVDNRYYIIYPEFDNIKRPPGYVACFISISKWGNNVAECFNIESVTRNNYQMECLELDALLYNTLSNITIKNSKGINITTSANYYSSSATDPAKYLGGVGHLDVVTDKEVTDKCWLVITSVNRPYNKTLVKLTPYITLRTLPRNYDNYYDINSPGYYCKVTKLNRDLCNPTPNNNDKGYYVSGNDIYERNIDGTTITLDEISTFLEYGSSNTYHIFSNFNLNYVSLSQDLQTIIRRYNIESEGGIQNSDKQYITLVDSLICSFILELKSMYRDYTKKLYYEYTKNKLVEFNNTIRCSNIDVDEVYRYIYKFDATDYYNVPTQRGVITNLISIANSIYVHCEHSLFKFTDNKTLNAQEEEVTLQENDIFNSGITEVFDAQYGYAGLKNREQSLITYNSYVFYDEVTKTIYAFGGEQQIGTISDSIQKIINDINPTDVRFVGDETHDRFFVNFKNKYGNVCLSFNFNAKSFISIHDIEFNFGFHSRRNTYFIHENYYNNNPMGWSIYKVVDYVLTVRQRTNIPNQDSIEINGITYIKNYAAYQNCYKKSLIRINDCDTNIILNDVKAVNSCVDIMVNTEYETIKSLNYISWICSEIKGYGNTNNEVSEETLNRKYGGTKLRIYSDSTETALIELLNNVGEAKIANENRQYFDEQHNRANSRAWQYPQYNCGVWSMNYFRDIKNISDIFDYKNPTNEIIGQEGHETSVNLTPNIVRQNLTQENSLLYGKYFVVRFIFNNRNFKLENVILKMNNYDKTK